MSNALDGDVRQNVTRVQTLQQGWRTFTVSNNTTRPGFRGAPLLGHYASEPFRARTMQAFCAESIEPVTLTNEPTFQFVQNGQIVFQMTYKYAEMSPTKYAERLAACEEHLLTGSHSCGYYLVDTPPWEHGVLRHTTPLIDGIHGTGVAALCTYWGAVSEHTIVCKWDRAVKRVQFCRIEALVLGDPVFDAYDMLNRAAAEQLYRDLIATCTRLYEVPIYTLSEWRRNHDA